jgi:two-component system phosphate regulon response regulator PhoB
MLPGISGLELLRRLRKNDSLRETPVIMLTARGEEIDRVRGLENGADDYITKPFSTKELLARIKTVLRRTSPHFSQETVTAGALRLDSSSHRVSVDDEDVNLGPTEFKLLQFFMTHPDRVYTRAQILDNVWGMNVYVEERTVDVHIRRLRKALEPHRQAHLIQTVRGYGYRFSSQ